LVKSMHMHQVPSLFQTIIGSSNPMAEVHFFEYLCFHQLGNLLASFPGIPVMLEGAHAKTSRFSLKILHSSSLDRADKLASIATGCPGVRHLDALNFMKYVSADDGDTDWMGNFMTEWIVEAIAPRRLIPGRPSITL
ncbi:hypothetical protein Tco_0105532, partial [Tanacetum coccineum]